MSGVEGSLQHPERSRRMLGFARHPFIYLADVIFFQHKGLFFKDEEPAVNKGRHFLIFEDTALLFDS